MNGTFTVVRPAPPPDTTKTLTAKVTATAVSLSAKKATAGSYKLTVADRSKTRNFHLVGPGVNRKHEQEVHRQRRRGGSRSRRGDVPVRERPAPDGPPRRRDG